MSAGVSIVPSGVPSAFQSRMVRALSPLASWAPSPRQAADSTSPAWPVRSLTGVPAARSQSLSSFADAAAACLPSGFSARAWTPAGWPASFEPGTAAGELPDLGRLVEAPREDPLAVGGDRDGQDEARVPVEPLDLLAGGGVPEPDRVVEAAGDQRLAVGAPGDRINRVGMAVERADYRCRLLRQGKTRGRQRRQRGDNNPGADSEGTEHDDLSLRGTAVPRETGSVESGPALRHDDWEGRSPRWPRARPRAETREVIEVRADSFF